MSASLDRLYGLLPAAFRVRDAAEGSVLAAFLAVIEEQAQALEDDIGALLDDWFVETCAEWVVPYVGDLVGARDILPAAPDSFSRRGLVANTIAYRRRKGTAAVLERLARDVSGWPALAVEMFQRLATTQSLDHVRPGSLATADLRRRARPELAGTAFETATHTVDVRHVDVGRGRYNLPDVALLLWRLQPYPVERSTARLTTDLGGCFTFNPLGVDTQLFNLARTEAGVAPVTEEVDIPGPLRRRPLFDERAARLAGMPLAGTTDQGYFGNEPVLGVFVDGAAVPSERMAICHLGGWRRPPTGADVAVDPVLGRLTLAEGAVTRSPVEVSYAYGFAGDLGGGPYDRQASVAGALTRPVDWQVSVGSDGGTVATLELAVQAWNALPAGQVGVIAVLDNRSYTAPTTPIEIREGSQLLLVAAGWPEEEGGGRVPGRLDAVGRRPHVRGDLVVHGASTPGSRKPGSLAVDGLLLEGGIRITPGNLGALRIAHSTVVPGARWHAIAAETNTDGGVNAGLLVVLERTICGPVALSADIRLTVVDSVVDAPYIPDGTANAIHAGATEIRESTVFGIVGVRTLEASNCIFTRTAYAERRQLGCVRYSYVPVDSQVARRFRCQPAPPATVESAARVAPIFVSTRYGDPGYAQLAASCPSEVAAGGSDESQMGAFSFLFEPQRLKNLRGALQDYLRVGLEAGVFFVT